MRLPVYVPPESLASMTEYRSPGMALGPVHVIETCSKVTTLKSSETMHVRMRLVPAYRGAVWSSVMVTLGWGTVEKREGGMDKFKPHRVHHGDLLCTVRVALSWPLTDTPTDGTSTVAWQVYWPASDVLTGSRVCIREGPEPLATTLLLWATHWTVGATVKKETTETLHSRLY